MFFFIAALTIACSPLFSFSQQVKDAQVLLNSLGFDAGLEDGLDGRRTKLALIEFYASQQKTFDGELSDNELFDLINFINTKAVKEPPQSVQYQEETNGGNYFVIILFFGLLAFVIFILQEKRHKPNPHFTPQPVSRSFSRNPNNFTKRQAKQIPAITGKCHVVDGDTIHIGKHKIRLAGINAPELDEPYGQKAKWALVNLCKGQDGTNVRYSTVS